MRLIKPFFSPKTISECLSSIFVILGTVYCAISILMIIPKSPFNIIFSSFLQVGLGLLFAALCLWIFAQIHHKKMDTLRQNGFSVRGKVLAVRHYRYINFSYKAFKKRHPWRIWYEYHYNGQTFRAHSDLLWEPPTLNAGDSIFVLIDVDRSGISCPNIASEQN